MTTAFNSQSTRDLEKHPQHHDEGNVISAPTEFGVLDTASPAYTSCGPNALLAADSVPVFKETRKAGDVDRVNITRTKENHNAVLVTQITDNNVALVKWAMNKPNGSDTCDISKQFVQSYKIAGTETYEIFLGCLPARSEVFLDPEDRWILQVDLLVADIYETQSANGGMTTPTFATQDTGTGWIGSDGGNDSFVHNANPYAEFGVSFVSTYSHAIVRGSEDTNIKHAKVTQRACSGVYKIFKKDMTLGSESIAGTKRTTARTMKTATLTATVTNTLFNNDPKPNLGPDQTGATIIDKAWTADSFAFA